MLPKTRKAVEREMKYQWESFRWLFKEKLTEMDFMTRRMMAEMSSLRIPREMVTEFVQQEFARLWQEVLAEENTKYGENGRRIGEGKHAVHRN